MMEQKKLREREAQCTQEQPAACSAACPVHVDVRGLAGAVQKGDFTAGLAILKKNVPFPGIIARICDQPCRQACKRGAAGEAMAVRALEKACVDYGGQACGKVAALPKKNKRVAVVGAGLSGLTLTFDLARKGYQVVVFEAGGSLGGSIRELPEEIMPQAVIDADLAVLTSLGVEVCYHSKVAQDGNGTADFAAICREFDAVYLGLGDKTVTASDFGLAVHEARLVIDPVTFATSREKVFAGGSQRLGPDRSPIRSVADGRRAAISIDRFLQQASLTASRDNEGAFASSLYTDMKGIEPAGAILPADAAQGYSREEAAAEAGRCLLCQCLVCVKVCEYLAHYRSYPKRYVREVYNNLSIVMGIHHANEMINSCSLCGLCREVCSGSLDMGEVCLEARRNMVEQGKMPPSAHDFALRDLAFTNSEACFLARHQPGFASSRVLFFPGCQLSASSPQNVTRIYAYLQEKIPGGVGLMLGCCGVPADWAGQQNIFAATLQMIRENWESMGKPHIIAGCPTCYQVFQERLPVTVEALWTTLAEIGLPAGAARESAGVLAIHDTCTTRHETALQDSVRSIVRRLGYQIEELDFSRQLTECCGYGGLMAFANREVAKKTVERRISQSQSDYLAYCSMCRDRFAAHGKRTFHLLDLIFGNPDVSPGPGFSERRENRARLKRTLLQKVWGETMTDQRETVQLIIPDQVRAIMEERLILTGDLEQTIAYAEANGAKLRNAATGHYLAYFKPASVTYWVEYSPTEAGFVIYNAYSHRMEIGE